MIEPEGEMGFLDHLEELRWRIIKGLLAIIVGSAVSFGFIDQILEILLKPTTATSYRIALQVLSVQGMFLIKWFIAFISGFVLAMPVVVYQIWKFVTPGLKINEKRYALPVVLFACISFITGVSFGYLVLIPFSLEFFSGMGAGLVENNFSITYYFSFLTWLLLGAGLVFQLPVLSLFLSAIGVLTPPFMRHYRRHAIVTILILSSFITPPDPVSMLMMAVPLVVLYEISIGVSWMVNHRREPV
ncbi:MAG: twin-arginine translocase subunit TatC [Candidatus Marinimicrobia bacterium]|jgi:sec-independent protein translocase protein TatC|nr:twin-arginine translocase subunit TatC [Candidatus Neomarinimicrobiota bacterium]MDP6167214.1 twin-arginine translocase subunit TatC [Candidatus Neomarinimicrobiota bacterium]MDP6400461.1 twin-arginine translocase subunit TatC [Candidatus Neomarinimicrobiota bacterium]MDP6613942.1 twin-arginine translocase subunit TatC [Candidatus Neomarinimicrobiota bacterium]MDP6819900.1 twin-arginine translocase subunit TatC [Candidatus Neomarinimicrobiota bacterium]|tara:strand:+ start:1675 stop:2406 length:732 start_codon:yes stop_codon:yes gene_type:complete